MTTLARNRKSKVATAAFLGFFGVSLLNAPQAQAQVAEGLTLLAGAAASGPVAPLLACAAFAEGGYTIFKGQDQAESLKEIAEKIDDLAGKQDKLLAAMASQRIVMREELKTAFLNNDCRELQALAHHFQIALTDGKPETKESELNSLRGRADELSTKLSLYGLAGVPAYLDAIALQNALHMAVHSSSETFSVINKKHSENLEAMLNGTDTDSVHGLAKATFNPEFIIDRELKGRLGSAKDLELLHSFRKDYPLYFLHKFYESETMAQVLEWTPTPQLSYTAGYQYQGFENGKAVLEWYIRPSKDVYGLTYGLIKKYAERGDEFVVAGTEQPPTPTDTSVLQGVYIITNINGVISSEYKQIPELQPNTDWLFGTKVKAYETHKDEKGSYPVPAKAGLDINKQYDAISKYYGKFYDPKMGDISAEGDLKTFMLNDPACHNMIVMLEKGLKAVRTMQKISPAHSPSEAEPALDR